jgi:hypothetical protein
MSVRTVPISLPWLLVLHLLPGALATLVFVLLAAPVSAAYSQHIQETHETHETGSIRVQMRDQTEGMRASLYEPHHAIARRPPLVA